MDFSQAQFEGGTAPIAPQCAVCQQPLTTEYWSANGLTMCATCAAQLEAGPPPEGGFVRAFKAIVFGSGAGLVGAIGYGAIIYLTDYQLALITILIGWMVGRAVKAGSEGRGGRGYQVLATVLTYVFCNEAFVPVLMKQATEGQDAASSVIAAIVSPFLALAIPFLGEMGPIGILILAFGMYQAWKEAAKPVVNVEGPFAIAQEPAPEAAAVP